MSGEQHDAVIEQMRAQAVALREAHQARDMLVAMLDLEPMGGRPGGRATWDDVVAYVGKVQDTRDRAMRAVERRHGLLAAALDQPADAPHPAMIRRVMALTEREHLR